MVYPRMDLGIFKLNKMGTKFQFVFKSLNQLNIFFSSLQTPLDPSSVDVAIFCLSLMGTNYPSYLEEANRVLKPRSAQIISYCNFTAKGLCLLFSLLIDFLLQWLACYCRSAK